MKISDSSISFRSSNFQIGLDGVTTDPTSTNSQPSPALSLAPRNTPFAALLHETLNAASNRVSQTIAVSSKSKIVRQLSSPQQIAHAKLINRTFQMSAQSADVQWRGSLFGHTGTIMRSNSLAMFFMSTSKVTLDTDFLLRIYAGANSYSNIFLAFLWYQENGLMPLATQQQVTNNNPPPDILLPQLPSPQIGFECQQMAFSSCGTVCIEDGREIEFEFNLNMTHSVLRGSASDTFAQWYALHDPLVLDLEGTGVGLGSEQFSFDLDGDGATETISCLDKGCGFLAYDQNQDGIINDGLELFGTVSGNGFTDLAQYDRDGNNWIDENDAIFDALSIWRQNDSGGGSLMSLAEAEVGAIYLDHSDSSFDLHDETDSFGGRVTASGIHLKGKRRGPVHPPGRLAMAAPSGQQETGGEEAEEVDLDGSATAQQDPVSA